MKKQKKSVHKQFIPKSQAENVVDLHFALKHCREEKGYVPLAVMAEVIINVLPDAEILAEWIVKKSKV